MGRPDFLTDDPLFTCQLVLIEDRVLQNVGENIGGKSHVVLEDAGE